MWQREYLKMMIRMTPCKDCQDRFVGCHSQCDKYSAFRKQVDMINHNRKVDSSINRFKIKATIDTNRKLGKE